MLPRIEQQELSRFDLMLEGRRERSSSVQCALNLGQLLVYHGTDQIASLTITRSVVCSVAHRMYVVLLDWLIDSCDLNRGMQPNCRNEPLRCLAGGVIRSNVRSME
ncbi:uncharacterized protein LOC129757210 [Uranotaenia lowii]|uniref:uncharacterized protein LOC129757210 n=1 Tax=Uranotaenia lowii TaxID=190385 RepID=UPI00247A8A38|nr:uncharacterized protein LOC129757210 [Uranotaenia lowii]